MTPDAALAALSATADSGKATEMARYHKAPRIYLCVANPDIDALARTWRQTLTLEDRIDLARNLWRSDIHEARIAAAKLLTQARIRPDDTVTWELIKSWVPNFDAWAIADHVSIAGQKRIVFEPVRLDDVEPWTTSPHMWTRRAALVMTLPWTRDRILDWAARYVDDRDWFIEKAVAWWLRDLSRRDPERTRTFLAEYGDRMKPFARREAALHIAKA